jgi:hypothetical protein
MNSAWPDNTFTFGYVGKGADGKRISGDCGAQFTSGHITSSLDSGSSSRVLEDGAKGVRYRHTKLTPGDYLVFVQRSNERLMLAWKRITVKSGDQKTVDLTIDPASSGTVTVKWMYENPFHNNNRPLALDPIELVGSGLLDEDAEPAVFVNDNINSITLANVPSGKYHVRTFGLAEDVEVKPGAEAQVTFDFNRRKP